MKFISWNVNGLRACVSKGFLESFYRLDADFFCLQETKLQEGQIDLDIPGYYQYWAYAQKKGYSGTAIFTKHKPIHVSYGLNVAELDTEGRLITLEYQEFYLVTCYTPNAQRELARIAHRMAWEDALRTYLTDLDTKKPVIYCGDLNVAHQEIDLKNPSSNRGNAGFSDQERGAFSRLLDCGFTDTFRFLYPNTTGAYSWWSYMFNARKNNAGWRIDYFVVSDRLRRNISDATIHPDILGSDHCPVGLDLDTTCNGSIWPTHTPRPKQNINSTDKDTSVGAVKALWHIVITAAIICILIGGRLSVGQNKPYQEINTPTSTSQISQLIADIWYPEEHVTFISGTSPYFKCGSNVWFPAEPFVNFDNFDRAPTFCAVITFDANANFTKSSLPQLQYKKISADQYFYEPYITHQFFYGSDERIAGFLLLADVPEDQDITLIIQDAFQFFRTDLHITAEYDQTDYSLYTTRQILDLLLSNANLNRLRNKVSSNRWMLDSYAQYDIEYFVTHDPAASELITRKDAVSSIFELMGSPIYMFDTRSNLLLLLECEKLHRQLSPEQKNDFELRWKEAFGNSEDWNVDEYFRGDLLITYNQFS